VRGAFSRDPDGRLVCVVHHAAGSSVVTASDPISAASELIAALDDVRASGYGECLWHEPNGDYRWMFKLDGTTVTVAVLWSGGTLTGWEHVLRGETNLDQLARQTANGLLGAGT